MPTYDYVCQRCGHEFELFQQMTAPVKRKCPECGENSLKRLIGTGAGVLFKGGGFYETDYRSDSYRKAAEAEKKAAEAKSDKSGGKGGKDAKASKKSESTGASSGGTGKKATKPTSKE